MNGFLSERRVPSAALICCLLGLVLPAFAVPIIDDPSGFEDIPWGATLPKEERFTKIEDAGRLQTYEQNGRPPLLGTIPVDSVRFTTFEKKVGRVTVRYSSNATHERIMMYLQSTYGLLDRTPGQIAVGAVKVYAWHGLYTEVTLRFETKLDRGIIFFESRMLPEKLADETSATAF
jgi:hypothetical protein